MEYGTFLKLLKRSHTKIGMSIMCNDAVPIWMIKDEMLKEGCSYQEFDKHIRLAFKNMSVLLELGCPIGEIHPDNHWLQFEGFSHRYYYLRVRY